jgi:hypothetical protein
MASKNLIIGAFTDYNYNQLKPWCESIDRCGFVGDKALVVGNSSEETINKLIKNNFIVIKMDQQLMKEAPIHVARFLSIYNFLKENWQKYNYIITTDVKDIYFQTDPIAWLKSNLKDKKIVAGSESMLYGDEPWNSQNFMQTYGSYLYEKFKYNEIYNVGTIGGESEYVKDLVLNIFYNAINRPIPFCDQPVFNVLIQTKPYKDIMYFAKQSDGWVCQAGTTVDPLKIESFRPFLLEKEPFFENGVVKNFLNKPFVMVHQYDRVPQWKEHIKNEYGQE